jgi:hypothetical protein
MQKRSVCEKKFITNLFCVEILKKRKFKKKRFKKRVIPINFYMAPGADPGPGQPRLQPGSWPRLYMHTALNFTEICRPQTAQPVSWASMTRVSPKSPPSKRVEMIQERRFAHARGRNELIYL